MTTQVKPACTTPVLYDGNCAMCMAGAQLLEKPLQARGLNSGTLQPASQAEAPAAMQIRRPDGRVLHGAECWVFIARQIWWARPVTWLAALPGGMTILHGAYAWVAKHRKQISRLPVWGLAAKRPRGRMLWIQTTIHASRERIWELTQTPQQHQRWDLRFSTIRYLPRQPQEPQQFEYVTRIGLGISITGGGETTGVRTNDNQTWTSALKFWSSDRLSLIRQGAGFWRYEQRGEDTLFLTRYEYQTRFGLVGRVADVAFRPLMAWATAWSFNRLKLWAERGTPPEALRTIAITATLARLAVAGFWLYGGLVPKLIAIAPDELEFARDTVRASMVVPVIHILGAIETILGLVILLRWQWRWPLWVTLALVPLALVVLGLSSPASLMNMFSPVVFNFSLADFAIIALMLQPLAPSSSRVQWGVGRVPREEAP